MTNPSATIFAALTPAQLEAVRHTHGPLLILAGPGSGKTRVVTHRIAFLIHENIPPRQILALTFTNKAADEMRLRLQRLAPGEPVWMGTFHRFCAQLLRQHATLVGLHENYSILDIDDSRKVLAAALDDADVDLSHTTPESVAAAISWAKNNLIAPEQYEPRPGHPVGAIVARAYPAYQKRMLAANAVDFDDLLLHVALLLRNNPELRRTLDERFRFIMVDEYQDTNLAQYAIVRSLSIDHPNLAVVGDPDQSIYGWRGANLGNILDFEHDFPQVRVVRLEQNYRSTQNILHVAQQLIAHNVRRKEKTLFTENPPGSRVRLIVFPTHQDEADQIASSIAADVHAGRRGPRDFAILYRTNALSRSLEHALREHGLPYQIIRGVEFYQRKEIKDVVAYLHLINNPQNNVALTRVINTPPRGIGASTIERLAVHADARQFSLLDAARECGLIAALPKRSAVAVAKFVALFDRMREHATAPVESILRIVLAESGYHQYLKDSGSEEDLERLANIEELITAARESDEQNPGDAPLEKFLEQAALVNDTDDFETETDKVTLMTLHAAKGLEFPVVFIVAVEQGLIPHERNKDDPEKVEEERRLLFVGITRAAEELQLSVAAKRAFRGEQRYTVPSPFLMELPRDVMELIKPPSAVRHDASWSDDPDAAAAAQDVWRDEEFVQDEPDLSVPPRTATAKISTAAPTLNADHSPAARFPAHQFRQGMLVTHPEYGSGCIVSLSGENQKRTAIVRFLGPAGEKTFRLAQSPLQPVASRS